MAVTAKDLRTLHELHILLGDTEAELERGPRLIQTRAKISQQREQDLEDRQKELKDMKMAADRKQLELRSIESKMITLQVKLNQISNQREYDAILKEIDADTSAKAVLEDEIIETLDRIELGNKAIVDAKAALVIAQQEFTKVEADIRGNMLLQQDQVAKLKVKIAEAEKFFPTEIAYQYRKVIAQKGAEGLAAVENAVCTNCYVSVTQQTFFKIKNNELLFCPSCTALMYCAPSIDKS
jgi:hypothetical protein